MSRQEKYTLLVFVLVVAIGLIQLRATRSREVQQ